VKTLKDIDEKLKPLQAVLADMPIYHTWNVLTVLAESYVGNLPDTDSLRGVDRLRSALATAIVEAQGGAT
jgi:hypothetical protein